MVDLLIIRNENQLRLAAEEKTAALEKEVL